MNSELYRRWVVQTDKTRLMHLATLELLRVPITIALMEQFRTFNYYADRPVVLVSLLPPNPQSWAGLFHSAPKIAMSMG